MNEPGSTKAPYPFCGETIEVLIDCSIDQLDYIEDCQICYRPIIYDVVVSPCGEFIVYVTGANA